MAKAFLSYFSLLKIHFFVSAISCLCFMCKILLRVGVVKQAAILFSTENPVEFAGFQFGCLDKKLGDFLIEISA